MSMLQRRLQVLIDDERHERLLAAARERGMSVGAVVREEIDRGLGASDTRGDRAASLVLGPEPLDVPDVDGLLAELDVLRGRRG